ncbi:recombinase family protein [Streptomyces sp. NPDC048643]|uniref:recombinase family protein n=1 Tax=Streptomyces sp. NPDC048643 TaxID=3155637 RepID=UPI00343787C5
MDIHYAVGSQKTGNGAESLPAHALRRQEARSLVNAGAMKRIALQEAISMVRLGVADHVCIAREEHLKDPRTRAVACAEALASGASVAIGGEPVTADRGPAGVHARDWETAWDATRERHRLLPSATGGPEKGRAYISPDWPTVEEYARLAHKLMNEMGYSLAKVAGILENVDQYDRPAAWSKQGIDRILWEKCDGERYPRYYYPEKSGATSRQAGRLHLPGASLHVMAVLGDEGAEAEARRFDADLAEPHHLVFPIDPGHPERGMPKMMQNVMDYGIFRTLYVARPDAVFSSRMQRNAVYDLALFRGAQVVENGTRIDPGKCHRLLREGTELFAALRIRDNNTVVEETRSLAHARKAATELRSQGYSVREIAAELDEEAIPTSSGRGKWSPSTISDLLSSKQ